MGAAVYILGTLTSLACALSLLKGFANTRMRLLLWSGLCFAGLSVSNFITFVDLVVVPSESFYFWRLLSAAVAISLLLCGLIWDSR